MHEVTNTGKETRALWHTDAEGNRVLTHIAPGESAVLGVHPGAPDFAEGSALKVGAKPVSAAKAAAAAQEKPAS